MPPIKIYIEIESPFCERQCAAMQLDASLWREALGPLPKNREIDFYARQAGLTQAAKRRQVVAAVASRFTGAIMDLLEKQDPVNGYPRPLSETATGPEPMPPYGS